MQPPLETLIPSKVRHKLFVELYGRGRHATASELASDLSLPYGATHRELQAFVRGGLARKVHWDGKKHYGPLLEGKLPALLRQLALTSLPQHDVPEEEIEIGDLLRRKAGVLKFAQKLRDGLESTQRK